MSLSTSRFSCDRRSGVTRVVPLGLIAHPTWTPGLMAPPIGDIVAARLQEQPQSIRPDALEPPREIGFDRMIARIVRELTDIGNADLRLRAQLQVATCFDECGVARDRDAQDAERRAGALERKQRARRHRAKGVLPRKRRARD